MNASLSQWIDAFAGLRIVVLGAALSCVDHLVAFDEDTPCNLVRVVRPDVFV